MEKKDYYEPQLIVFGNVEEITRGGVQPNADVPLGNNNAFSNL